MSCSGGRPASERQCALRPPKPRQRQHGNQRRGPRLRPRRLCHGRAVLTRCPWTRACACTCVQLCRRARVCMCSCIHVRSCMHAWRASCADSIDVDRCIEIGMASVCAHVCVCVCVCACVCVRMRIRMYVCVCARARVRVRVSVCVMSMSMSVCLPVCVCAIARVCVLRQRDRHICTYLRQYSRFLSWTLRVRSSSRAVQFRGD